MALNELYVTLVVLACTYCVFGIVGTIYYRKSPIIQVKIPLITIIEALCYLLFPLFGYFSIQNKVVCFIQLYAPYILLSGIGNAYMIKAMFLYVTSIKAKYSLHNLDAEGKFKTISRTSSSSDIQASVFKPARRMKMKTIDHFFYQRRSFWTNQKSLSRLYVILVASGILLPAIFHIAVKANQHLYCGEQQTFVIAILGILFALYVTGCIWMLIQLRGAFDSYGIKRQFKGSLISWLVIFILAIILSLIPSIRIVYRVFSCFVYVLPITFDIYLPLYEAYKLRTRKPREVSAYLTEVNIATVIAYKGEKNTEPGLAALASFLQQEYASTSSEDVNSLWNAILFIRELLNKRSKHLEDENKVEDAIQKLDLMIQHDQQFLGVAVILFQKYFQKRFLAGMHSVAQSEAMFLVPIRDDLYDELEEALNASLDTNSCSKEVEAKPGGIFRKIYADLVDNFTSTMFSEFLNSVPYEQFKKGVVQKELLSISVAS